MNHEKTHQTNPMAPWDPLDALSTPWDPLAGKCTGGPPTYLRVPQNAQSAFLRGPRVQWG